MINKIDCCVLALIAFIGNIIQLVFFFNYSLKIKDKNIELEKQKDKQETRIKELEKKNGAEQRQINELNEKVKQLEGKLPEKQ